MWKKWRNGKFKEPRRIAEFVGGKISNLEVKDLNNDGNLDISFLRKFYNTNQFKGSGIPHYELRTVLGNGDGTFKESEIAISYGTGSSSQ